MTEPFAPTACTGPPHCRADDYCVEDSIGYLLQLSLSAIRRRLERQMTRQELTGLQMLPLAVIGQNVCRSAAELARRNDIDPGATSRMLDRLEAKSLLRRVRSTEDRRVARLELTAEGQAIARKISCAIADTLNEALCDFSAEEVETLRGMLRRIVANAEAAT